jgi:hypothetical protein
VGAPACIRHEIGQYPRPSKLGCSRAKGVTIRAAIFSATHATARTHSPKTLPAGMRSRLTYATHEEFATRQSRKAKNFGTSGSERELGNLPNSCQNANQVVGRKAPRQTELRALRQLKRESPQSAFVFVSERGTPFSTAGFLKLVNRPSGAAKLGFQVHPHQLRHACGFKLANDGVDTHAASLSRSPEHSAYGALHRAGAAAVQGALEGLTTVKRLTRASGRRPAFG